MIPAENHKYDIVVLLSGYLCLLVRCRFPAPIAILFQIHLPFNRFLVFVRIIILPFADGAPERDQAVGTLCFCHGKDNTMLSKKRQTYASESEPLVGFEPATYSFIATSTFMKLI